MGDRAAMVIKGGEGQRSIVGRSWKTMDAIRERKRVVKATRQILPSGVSPESAEVTDPDQPDPRCWISFEPRSCEHSPR